MSASRISGIERYKAIAILSGYGLIAGLLLAIACRTLLSPLEPWIRGAIGFAVSVLAYLAFHKLYVRFRGPFVSLLEGTVLFLMVSIGSWMGFYSMIP